jgi:hypothetical protein
MAAEETLKIPQLKTIDSIPHFAVAELIKMRLKTSQASCIFKFLSAKFGPFEVVSRRHYAPLSQFVYLHGASDSKWFRIGMHGENGYIHIQSHVPNTNSLPKKSGLCNHNNESLCRTVCSPE